MLPARFRRIEEFAQTAVDDRQLAGIRRDGDWGFFGARTGETNLLVVGPAAQVEGDARLEAQGGVIDRLPRFGLGAVVVVVAFRGIDEVRRALVERRLRGDG